jgi:hypothetical protein
MAKLNVSCGVVLAITLFSVQNAAAACSGSGLSWNCTAGSTVGQVQTAVNTAADGATITFAAGTYTWGSGIELANDRGVTLQGAGAGSTIVNVTAGSVIGMSTLSGNNTHLYRITGFTFQNAPANLIFWFYGTGVLNNVRIDHNTFSNYASSSIAIFFGETGSNGKYFGVIDHNTFRGTVNYMAMKVLGPGDPSRYPSSVRGTSSNIFLEDNVFDFDSATDLGSGCIDAWWSSAVVFRFNTVRNCLVTAHGTTHGGGTVNFEVYENTLKRQGGDATWQDGTRLIHHQGSGEITVWGNTFVHSGTIGSALSITHYRSAPPSTAGYDSTLGRCSGSMARDGNTASQSGWPCWNQPGRAPSGGSPVYGVLSPIYAWQNVDSSTNGKVGIEIENPWGVTGPSVADHIKAGRDYYDAVSQSSQTSSSSPFNGTTGMGFGTLANRPSSCTHPVAPNGENGGGVAYWATDQGEWNSMSAGPDGQLYRCSATNTWSVAYIPYTYPHPLQGGKVTPVPSAPTHLRIVVP